MTNISNESIKLRKDGSVDTNFYMTRGRYARSQQAYNISGTAFRNVSVSIDLIMNALRQIASQSTAQTAR